MNDDSNFSGSPPKSQEGNAPEKAERKRGMTYIDYMNQLSHWMKTHEHSDKAIVLYVNNPKTDYFTDKAANAAGVPAAVVLKHLYTHTERARENGENFHDGRFWCPASVKALSAEIPYLSSEQIRTALKKLNEGGYIVKSNYNRNRHDRTLWYALTDAGRGLMQ